MAAYKIGNFTFDTEEEYARGLEDAKKIEKIQNTVDLNEPETALRLYWLIRTGKIKFGSKVGKKFFLDIADAVSYTHLDVYKRQCQRRYATMWMPMAPR